MSKMLKAYSNHDYNDSDSWTSVAGGCSCHNSKKFRRKIKKSTKKKEQARWRKEEGV